MLVRLFDPMAIGIARKHERQGAVACDIARSAETILQGEYGEHERRGRIAETEHAP